MTTFQKIIKYVAIFLAISLCVSIFSGIATAGLAVVGALGLFGNQPVSYTTTETDLSAPSLELKIGTSDLKIKTGDKFSIEADENRMNVSISGDKVLVEEKKTGFFSKWKASELTIQIPKDYVFEAAKIDSGVGKVSVDGLKAKDLSINLGVGEVEMKNLTVEGADVNCGIGKVSLELTGVEEDYTFKMNRGIGSISLNGNSVSDDSTIGKGQYKIAVDGGIGEVNVRTATAKADEEKVEQAEPEVKEN